MKKTIKKERMNLPLKLNTELSDLQLFTKA